MGILAHLSRLVAFPSVVGSSNGEIIAWVRSCLEEHGAQIDVLPGPEGDRANLFASFGPRDVPGYVLSGHCDVVPAGEGWSSDPFELRLDNARAYGRGACDMKGFLAVMLAMAPAMAIARLRRPIHLAISYDEEAGCRGVPHLLARLPGLCALPAGAIIGEPSGMRAVLAHKGKAAVRIAMRGRGGHSSRPDLGLNAIHALVPVLAEAVQLAGLLAAGPCDPVFEPPYSTLQVGTLKGGQAINIIPERCEAEIEVRAIAGVDPAALLTPLKAHLEARVRAGEALEWSELSRYPALSLLPDAPLARLIERITGQKALAAVSYGTEAGLFQAAGVPAIICGPGDIAQAHKPDEFVAVQALEECRRMIERIIAECC